MNILLADDERLTRLGLKSMIEELYPGICHFSETDNGERLLEYLKDNRPDLIFLDIHMPRLTGLQAFSQFSEMKIPVIMLTGYAEFAYAQEALRLGALDYLLKPVSLEELHTSMEKAMILCREQELLLRKDYELEFEKLLDLHTSIGFIQTPRIVLPPYTAVLFYFDHYQKHSFGQDLASLTRALEELSGSCSPRFAFSFLATGEMCYLSSSVIDSEHFQKALSEFHRQSACTVTGFYVAAHSLPDLFAKLESIQKEESLRFCAGLGSLISEKEREDWNHLLPLSELLEKLFMAHRSNDAAGFQSLLKALERLGKQMPDLISRCLKSPSLNRILSMESGKQAAVQNKEQLIGFLGQMTSQNQTIHLVDKINAYVEKNYMNQIGINTIADMIDISPNYLSRIYKLKTGENFIDHLTGVRISKAMELMSSGAVTTVREAAEQVGYFSTRYFTKVFLKNTGITPSEYIKQHIFTRE